MGENFTNGEGRHFEEDIVDKNSQLSSDMPSGKRINWDAWQSGSDIDELQQRIMKQMAADEEAQNDYFDDFESAENFAEENAQHSFTVNSNEPLENQYYDISPCEKKYVISINPDIVPMFDKMTPESRTALVNKLVLSYMETQKNSPEKMRIKKLVSHLAVVFITIAVGFPLLFFVTNASIEATVNSYRQIQSNFEKLYQQKGGVKRKDLTKIQNLQY